MSSEELLTTGQVAKLAQVHRTTVHHWECDGKLDAAQVVHGMRMFRRGDVEQFLADRAEEAAAS